MLSLEIVHDHTVSMVKNVLDTDDSVIQVGDLNGCQ